jgi:hypothetical protein
MMLGNKECHFPASRLDEISRQLSPVSVGEELPTIACVVAATTLQYISLSNQEDVGKALDRLEHFKNAYLKYQLDLCTRNILVPITPALGELDTLIRFIDANPIQLDRYRCLRELTPDQPKGPLCGLHRDAWKDFSLSFQDKKHMWDYLTNLPDRAGDPEAFSKYAEEYILPAEHPNFFEHRILLCLASFFFIALYEGKNATSISPTRTSVSFPCATSIMLFVNLAI